MELGTDVPPPQQSANSSNVNMKNIFRAMGVVFVPVAFTMPAGVLIYWTTTNIFGLFQRALFQSRAVQQFLGWPLPEDMPAAKPPAEVWKPLVFFSSLRLFVMETDRDFGI